MDNQPIPWKNSKNYIVSEKIYEYFSKHAAAHQIDENAFE